MNIIELILKNEYYADLLKEQEKKIAELERENIKLKAVKSLTN